MKKLKFYTVSEKYVDYLRTFDNKVPILHKSLFPQPFVGVVLEIRESNFFVPLFFIKNGRSKLKKRPDFLKINQGKLGGFNFSQMIPISTSEISEVSVNLINDERYKKILNKQLRWCNTWKNDSKIEEKAASLYQSYLTETLPQIRYSKCCDFPNLIKISEKYENDFIFKNIAIAETEKLQYN
jgi:hypothetical protein